MLGKLIAIIAVGIGILLTGGLLLAQTLPEWAPYREGQPSSGVTLTLPVVSILGAWVSAILGFVAVVAGLVLIGTAIRAAFRHHTERLSHR